jgi:sugar/nucleoside kinase (ribokinase family)
MLRCLTSSDELSGMSDNDDEQRVSLPRPEVVCAGLLVADMFVPPLDRLPGAGELLAIDHPQTDVGGCAANTATALVGLGVSTSLAARVGSDAQGEWVRERLQQRGVDVKGVLTSALPTSQTVILPVRGEDRRYLHAAGANRDLTASEIRALAEHSSILAVGGFLALPGLAAEALAQVFADTRKRGAKTVLDVVISPSVAHAANSLRTVLPFVDCFLPNQDEAYYLTGEDDVDAQAQTFLGWGCSSVVITRGLEGALYADADIAIGVNPLEVDYVDGSGAGDAFAAGLIVGLLEDWPIEFTLRFAAAVGASATRGIGCTSTLFTRAEALAYAEQVVVDSTK